MRSFLAAWWSARAKGGQILVRIEDVDESRSRPEYVQAAIEDLAWLGIDWDGDPILQTDLQAQHQSALESLKAQNLVYPCVCTRKDIERAASAPHREDGSRPYPGTCRDRFADGPTAWRATGREPAWRFRTQGQGTLEWTDGLHGSQAMDLEQGLGDFVVWTKAGRAAYQLAVTVDDGAAGITQVVRGEDLIESTFAQLALQQALGLTPPSYWHLGLVQDDLGKRLAKRTGAHSVRNLRGSGVPARDIVDWLAGSLGMEPSGGLAETYVQQFDWSVAGAKAVNAPQAWCK